MKWHYEDQTTFYYFSTFRFFCLTYALSGTNFQYMTHIRDTNKKSIQNNRFIHILVISVCFRFHRNQKSCAPQFFLTFSISFFCLLLLLLLPVIFPFYFYLLKMCLVEGLCCVFFHATHTTSILVYKHWISIYTFLRIHITHKMY